MSRRWAELPLWVWSIFGFVSVVLIGLSATARVPVSLYEAIGFTTGIASVWLMKVGSWVNWPIGIVNASVYAVLFLNDRLLGDGSLAVFYVASGFIGWMWWTVRGPGATPKIRRANPRELWIGTAIALAGAALLTPYFLHKGDPAPLLDSVVTAFSVLGQWLLMRRAIENWWLWIAADLVAVPLFWSRNFHLTAILYALYLVLAVLGLLEWQAQMVRRNAVRP